MKMRKFHLKEAIKTVYTELIFLLKIIPICGLN